MLTAEDILKAQSKTEYSPGDVLHEHDDCIRMAYEWLDAQVITKGVMKTTKPIKHIIEKWAGRYVSQNDVEVAASLHSDIKGKHPLYNISSKLTLPKIDRLEDITEANTYDYRKSFDEKVYSRRE